MATPRGYRVPSSSDVVALSAITNLASDIDTDVGAHVADTTSVHGIADTSKLLLSTDTGSVGTTMLADNAVTADKIATGAVGSTEIATGAVTASELATGAVGAVEIADSAVTADKIATGAVGVTELAPATCPDGAHLVADSAGTSGLSWVPQAGSALRTLPAAIPAAELLLKQAALWLDAGHASASGQTLTNLGWAGSALNATVGSSASADSNDPKFLDWDGTNYIYLPGTSGNYLTTDTTALNVSGDLDVRVRAALDDWTPATANTLAGKYAVGDISWRLYVNSGTGGQIVLQWTVDGSTSLTATSTVGTGLADGTAAWIRATLDLDNGSSGHDVAFWTSTDGVTWTQLGDTVTSAGTTSIWAGSAAISVGATSTGTGQATGKFYRAQVFDSAVQVLDVDTSLATGSSTTATMGSGHILTIERATAGKKSAVVTAPVLSFGSDDYLEVADSPLLDFAASESFTVLCVHRSWATFGTNDALVAKKPDTTVTTQGWALTASSSTAAIARLQAGDGTNGANATSGSRTSGALSVVTGVRDTSGDTLTVYLGTTPGTPVTDPTTGSLANSSVLRVGRLSGAGTEYSDMTLYTVALWRRALTSGEITTLNTYFTNRIGA